MQLSFPNEALEGHNNRLCGFRRGQLGKKARELGRRLCACSDAYLPEVFQISFVACNEQHGRLYETENIKHKMF